MAHACGQQQQRQKRIAFISGHDQLIMTSSWFVAVQRTLLPGVRKQLLSNAFQLPAS
jgi:hypothetical protein